MKEFHLFIFAFDTLSDTMLRKLNLPDVTVISLNEFENEKLLAVKSSRSRAEYCWTCTSSTIDYVLEYYKVPACTYLDADIFFYGSPEVLLDELKNGKNVLITEHRFSRFARLFEQRRAGRFCVQFITFADKADSRKVLDIWKNQCIDWCYARYEDGKFGDQKYLENWPVQYDNVHVLSHPGGGIAPWNARQFNFVGENDKLYGIKPGSGERFEVIFFHFHYIRLLHSGYADLGWNRLPEKVKVLFYKPYISRMIEKEIILEDKFPEYKRPVFDESASGIKESAKSWFKSITHFNLLNVSKTRPD